jgi:hypothetical protein
LTKITGAACPRLESGTLLPIERRALKWRSVIENECIVEEGEETWCIMHGDIYLDDRTCAVGKKGKYDHSSVDDARKYLQLLIKVMRKNQCYGSGAGFFHQQAKKLRKSMISSV